MLRKLLTEAESKDALRHGIEHVHWKLQSVGIPMHCDEAHISGYYDFLYFFLCMKNIWWLIYCLQFCVGAMYQQGRCRGA